MNIEQATRTIWNYHLMNHKLSPADMLFVLGHHDLRIPVYVAELYKQGFAPLVVCSGSGTIHKGSPRREQFGDKTEAEVFRDILIREGVPEEVYKNLHAPEYYELWKKNDRECYEAYKPKEIADSIIKNY